MGRELSTIVRDLPIEIDLEAARLGDYDRDTVVRLFREYEFRTLIERLPPMAGESRRAADREPPVRRRERLRAGGARRRPARGLGRRPGDRAGPRAASSSSASTSTRWRGAAPTAPAGRRRDGRRRARTDRPSSRPTTCRPRSPPRSSIPGRIEVRGAGPDRRRSSRWIAAQPAVGASLARRRPAAAARHAARPRRRRRGRPGRRRRRRRRPPTRCATSSRRPASPLVGHEVKPVLVAGFADDLERSAPTAGRLRHPDRGLHPQRRAAQPDDRRRRRREPRPDPAAGEGAAGDGPRRARGAVGDRRPRAARAAARRGRGSSGCSARSSCRSSRSSPGWRRSASPSTSRRSASSTASSAPRSTGSSRRSTSTSATSSTSAAPSSSSRSCSSSSNLPKGKRTKTGYSTDASVLEELRPAHPMIDKLLEWRIYTKLRSTYVEALPTLIAADGRLHTTFHQAVAATGRLSSSDPNLQNIPIRTALGRRIRRAFVAGEPDLVAARRRLLADRAADPRPRLGRRAPQGRVRAAAPTSTARPPPACSTRTRTTSPTASGRWPRWSTSGWPTG